MVSGIPFTITKIFAAKRANRNCPNRYKQITQQLKVNASRGGLKRSKIKNHSSFSYSETKSIYMTRYFKELVIHTFPPSRTIIFFLSCQSIKLLGSEFRLASSRLQLAFILIISMIEDIETFITAVCAIDIDSSRRRILI